MPFAREDLDSNCVTLVKGRGALGELPALVNMDGVEDMVELWAKPQLRLRVEQPQCTAGQSVV
jgi:hypothetical protein